MALPRVGAEAVIEGMAKYEADAKKVSQGFFDMDAGASKLGKGATGLTTSLGSLGASILNIGVVAGGVALAGVTAFAAGLATFAIGGIKQAIDLDQQVANIAATMGATQETAGTLKEELKGLALDLSLNPDLTVDVTQAGQAIEVLAANGALATDEFGKLTEASKDLAVQTVALANATGSDFTTAATIATDAMALFGLETDEMGKAVDGAAGIMNASKFNAQDYQLALSNAGGIAAEMGISIEDFNTVLAGTASNFASGSDAGTSFKTLMQRLANPTDEVKAAMQQYGISLFDANGNMRNMSDIAQDLNQVFNGTVTVTSQVGGATKEQAAAAATASKNMGDLTRDIGENRDKLKLMTDVYQESLKFYDAGEPRMRKQALAIQSLTNNITDQEEKLAGYNAALATVDGAQARTVTSTQQLTEAQKAQLAATLGGADGSRILLGLADLTAEEFNTLSESVNRTGQGLEAAALRVDTAKGAMDIFKGVLQAIQIQVGDKFLPLLKEMAVNFTQLATQNGPMIVEFFGQVATAIGNTIDNISTSIGKISGAFQRFGARGAAVSILGQLGLEPEQITQVMSVVDQVVGSIDKITGAFERFGLKGAAVSIMGQLGIDPETIGTIFTTIDTITEKITTLQTIFAQFGAMGAGVSLLSMMGLSSETIALITTTLQTITNGFAAFSNWWITNWPMMQAVALTAWEVIKGIFAGFVTALGPTITQFQATVTQFVGTLSSMIGSLGLTWGDVFTALGTATKIVGAIIGAVILGIIGVVAGLANAVLSGITATIAMFQSLSDNVAGILQGLTTIFSGWIIVISSLLSGDFARAWEGFKVVLQGAATFWTSIWTGMLEGVLGIVGIISSTIGGFVQGVVGFFQGMYDQLVGNSIIPDLINDIVSWFKGLPQKVVSALSNLVSLVIAPFEDAYDAIIEVWKPQVWLELGMSIIDGIMEGIKENQDKVLEMLKSLAADALQAAKDAIGWGSPAREFLTIGESMVQGMLVGAESVGFAKQFIDDLNMGGIARSLGTGGGQWRNFRNIIKNQIGSSFEQLMTSGMSPAEIINQIQQVATRFNFPPSFASEFAMANGLIEHLTSSVTEFQQAMRLENMGKMAQIGGQFSSLGQAFVDMLKPVNEEKMQILQDFLSGKVAGRMFAHPLTGALTEMVVLQQDGLEVALNRSLAQQELNKLLVEQRRQEELITQQKEAQQKLSFLQAQLDLIKLGKELGGNIFRGITFGLNASVTDLLAATNSVVEAMIGQINEDLQIASPSKVMARIGQQMMAGLQGGLISMTPMLNAQLSASVAGPISPLMAGAMGGGGSSNVTNVFNTGGNNISNGMNAAEFEARVIQVIRRNL